ncbi:putative 8-amino-7-oxononanoate synthase [Kordiimonas sediminis]|uniref:8-amino-7-oxononanoate synthase n=1 Tax=Kordiimonas sediminis TaxID=1735581 RepID=A0A919ART1_9PROT|nr:8-amino-7-oxononanoate synthase [Kordiimonas sediminis]GHF22873.1 putative 8-amino-7-oxononanoate synthase [Kordiimonas sediminis]
MSSDSNNQNHTSLLGFVRQKLSSIEARNQRRALFDHTRSDGMQAVREGVGTIVSFTDNDYLGLSTHPAVIGAANAATAMYGAGAGASRLVTGNHPLYAELEAALASLKDTEDAVVFGSGYLANVGIIPTFVGPRDLIVADALIHTSIHAGVTLSRAAFKTFRHNDTADLEAILKAERHSYERVLIVVDGVYSMDGDIAPLHALGLVAEKYDCWLMSDDAHGVGVIGGGRGSAHACDAQGLVPLQMGTLSKAVGGYGGYLAASKDVCDLVRTRARSLIYTTALPPGVVAGALKALNIIKTDTDLCARPVRLAQYFCRALGLPAAQTPIVPVVIGDEKDALAASEALAKRGFLAWAFRPPTVPVGTSRLRFCFSATHTDQMVDDLITACRDLGIGDS